VVEDVHGVVGPRLDLEPLVGAPVVDDDGQAPVVLCPEQGDLEPVTEAVRELALPLLLQRLHELSLPRESFVA
jgi:hypothetical protein